MDPNEVPAIRPGKSRRPQSGREQDSSQNPSKFAPLGANGSAPRSANEPAPRGANGSAPRGSSHNQSTQDQVPAQIIPPRGAQTANPVPRIQPRPTTSGPQTQAPQPASRPQQQTKRSYKKLLLIPVLLVALLIAWPLYLYHTTSSQMDTTQALSNKPATTGTTYLIAGSDKRGDKGGIAEDGTEGERTDSMILVHKADNGNVSVVSLPRDADVKIPGKNRNKLNAAFAYGGAPLLVQTVENLTGFKVDHFIIIGMGGVSQIVDALGGVNLCLDFDVQDKNSKLNWKSGCHDVNGETALAFARMRYADPRGDLGRQDRQRQVISKVVKKALSPTVLLNPFTQYDLAVAGGSAVTVDQDSGLSSIVGLVKDYRSATQAGTLGTPPVKNLNYRAGHGSSVQLDPKETPIFFQKIANGTAKPEDFNRFTGK